MAFFRLSPFREASPSTFFASSFRKRTDLTLPFLVIVYSTPGLISIVTFPASLLPSAMGATTPMPSTKMRHAASAAIHCGRSFLRGTCACGLASVINRSSIWPIAFNNFSLFIRKHPPFQVVFSVRCACEIIKPSHCFRSLHKKPRCPVWSIGTNTGG